VSLSAYKKLFGVGPLGTLITLLLFFLAWLIDGKMGHVNILIRPFPLRCAFFFTCGPFSPSKTGGKTINCAPGGRFGIFAIPCMRLRVSIEIKHWHLGGSPAWIKKSALFRMKTANKLLSIGFHNACKPGPLQRKPAMKFLLIREIAVISGIFKIQSPQHVAWPLQKGEP